MKNIVLPLLLITANIYSQPIVNIENLRHSGEIGVFKSAGISFNGSRGNEDRDDYSLNFTYVNNNEIIESLFTASKSERTKDDIIEDESSFFHGRLLFKSEKNNNLETYIQSSRNPFQSYKERNLVGLGYRFSISKDQKIGLSIMHEDEHSLDGTTKQVERFNLYFSRVFALEGKNSLSASFFYQPSIKDIDSDYKASGLMTLNLPISENFSLDVQLSSSIDNDPPDLSKKSNHSFSTNFRYKF
ncbi:DUF481 domain-containing protein [Gammaproteobacteria bacterium]|jgi:hypothetical protein|nr:DUF481 domain-containing protein [Gammaproteobacteria bacterium]MDA9867562.1 DUF481 domain-containing protein [Gammaproteobacteria bacterium]